jgi:hypothetical protein
MDILRIIHRLCVNFLKDIPLTPRRIRAVYRMRRRNEAWRANEIDRLDRIRNPSKYRGR